MEFEGSRSWPSGEDISIYPGSIQLKASLWDFECGGGRDTKMQEQVEIHPDTGSGGSRIHCGVQAVMMIY